MELVELHLRQRRRFSGQTSRTFTPPSLDKAKLQLLSVPALADWHLEHSPHHPRFTFPALSSGDQPVVITWLEYGRAIHRATRWLEAELEGVPRGTTIGMLTPVGGAVHYAVVVGLMRLGYKPLLISHLLNTSVAATRLLSACDCHRLFISASLPLVQEVKSELEAQHFDCQYFEMPQLPQLYPHFGHETAADPFDPLPKHIEGADFDFGAVAMTLHSTGSTSGIPKPLPLTHRRLLYDALCLSDHGDVDLCGTTWSLFGLQPPQAISVVFALCAGNIVGIVSAWPHPLADAPPQFDASLVLQDVLATRCGWIISTPAFLEGCMRIEGAMPKLAAFAGMLIGGAPLSRETADALLAHDVSLKASYGMTETGLVNVPVVNDVPWPWMRRSPISAFRLEPLSGESTDGEEVLCELVMETTSAYAPSAYTDAAKKEFRTGDVFALHKADDNVVRFVSRRDDIIVFSNGMKTDPFPIESAVAVCPDVAACIVFGAKRSRNGILIEPTPLAAGRSTEELHRSVWPHIAGINDKIPKHSCIDERLVVFTRADKPLPRTAKHSVPRGVALKLYDEPIDAAYAALG